MTVGETKSSSMVINELGAASREVIAEIGGEFSGAATKFFEERKANAVETIGAVASALHSAAKELGDKSPPIAKYAERSAGAIEGFSNRLADGRWGDLIGGAGRLSEERPAVFMMICAGAGMAAGALLVGWRRDARIEDAPRMEANTPGEGRND
jgi:hypothetical protein